MRILVILFLFVNVLSCKSSVQKDILPPKKMQTILWDMMQADEMAEYNSTNDSSFKGVAKHIVYYQNIFAIHKVSRETFKKSLNYYKDHPASLKPILDSLQHFAQRLQVSDTSKKKTPKPIDSDTLKRKLHVRIHKM